MKDNPVWAIVLLAIGALFTLLVSFIKDNWLTKKDRRSITIYTSLDPVVSVGDAPQGLLSDETQSVIRFEATYLNTGSLQISDATVLLQADEPARILADRLVTRTKPSLGVSSNRAQSVTEERLVTTRSVTLEPGQSLTLTGYAAGPGPLPSIAFGVEGGGGELQVEEQRGGAPGERSAADHVAHGLYNLVLAQVGPTLLAGLGIATSSIVIVNDFYYQEVQGGINGAAVIAGAMWQLLFYLRSIREFLEAAKKWRLVST